MTETQEELYNSYAFWCKREEDQWKYIAELDKRRPTFLWLYRYGQLLKSAYDVMKRIRLEKQRLVRQ